MKHAWLVVVSLVVLAAAPAPGGEPARDQPAPPASASPDPLSGPAVKPEESGAALVERGFSGEMKRPEVRPEEAALRKLTLSGRERQDTEAVLAERAEMLDGIVREHIDLLLNVQSARASGDKAALGAASKELRDALRPLAARGGLHAELRAALEPENAAKFDGLVRGYYRALLAEGRKTALTKSDMPAEGRGMDEMEDEASSRRSMDAMPDDAQAPPQRRERARVMLEVFGQEVRRSYERVAAEGQSRIDEVSEALDLSPEQREKVRALATEFAQKAKLNPTPAQRSELFGQILRELTPEQRVRALEYLLGRR